MMKKLAVPLITASAFWALAIIGWLTSGYLEMLLNFGYLGTALGGGLAMYALFPKKKKPLARRITLLAMGFYLLVLVGLISRNNIQIEGVVFSLLAGVAEAAVIHYLVAKVFGPVLFGRLWCGWACWSVMVFDLLPYQRSPGRKPLGWGRFAHFGLSVVGVLALWHVFDVHVGVSGWDAFAWLVAGNLLYYGVGIGMAVAFKDNRAFCKYLCPVSVPLKATSRFSILKVQGDAEKCNSCNACTKMCPMDVDIPAYVHEGQRVLSTECTLCQTCITVCAKDALKISAGFDLGGKEYLRQQEIPVIAGD